MLRSPILFAGSATLSTELGCMATQPASDTAQAAPQSRRLPGSGQVLVVEDESVIRETVQVLIAIEGCDARTAADGATALAMLEEWTPDVILLDLSLPRMTGEEFIQEYHSR